VDAVLPFLVAATVYGLARLPAAHRLRAVSMVLVFSVALALLVGPWPGAPAREPVHYAASLPASRIDALRAGVALVPKDVPVSASNDAGSHLAAREYAYTVPVIGRAEWIVLDTWDPSVPALPVGFRSPALIRKFRSDVENSPRWRKVFDRDGVLVFRKVTVS
jgi:hypothetical protein